MSKKLLTILSIFSILIIMLVPFSYADNTSDEIKQGAGALVDGVRNGVSYAENTVEGAVKDVGNSISGAANSVVNNDNNDLLKNDNYTATRTSATMGTLTTNNMFWTWIILAIAAVIIVALVWYYGSQRDNKID